MTNRTVSWLMLGLGVWFFSRALWQRTSRSPGSAPGAWLPGCMYVSIGLAQLTSGWISAASWIVAAGGSAIVGVRFFTERDRLAAWLGVLTLPLILAISLIEVLFDDINWWQRASMAAIAVFAVAAMVTSILRLARGRRRQREA